jgi:ABC-type transporter Mla subunit MlaD
MDRERDVIFSLQDAIKQTGVQLSDRIRYLEQLTEELNKRIQDLERK